MNREQFRITPRLFGDTLKAVLTIFLTTVPLFLIGRAALGDAVIALLYLVPVTWSASRWGLGPGMSAALTAALCFDFLFIPPFFTFSIGSLEGWLVLAIFLAVAIVVVERIQSSLSKARDATFMYELSRVLAEARTQDAVAHSLAREVQQLFQASLVNVIYRTGKGSPSIAVSQPLNTTREGRPDRLIPILNSWGLVGEIQIWRGSSIELPAEESRLLQNFASQAGRAFERTQPVELQEEVQGSPNRTLARE
jgi:K+-sensing histidine kinase KdpD